MSLHRTPLSRGASHDEQGRKRYSSFTGPRKPLARSRMKRALPKRIKRRSALSPYLAMVRSRDCVHCHRSGPSDAAHMTLGANEKGIGMKTPDHQAVPMCRSCHRAWDGHAGGPSNPFRGFTKDERYAVAAEWVRLTRLAAIPTTVEEAYALEAAGLGEVLRQVGGAGWAFRSVVLP